MRPIPVVALEMRLQSVPNEKMLKLALNNGGSWAKCGDTASLLAA